MLIFIVSCSGDDINSSSRTILNEPNFQYIGPNWIQQYNKISMRSIWLEHGINQDGYSYYFLPKSMAPNTCSERFNPLSKYFQSWFGFYRILGNSNGIYAIQNNELDAMKIIELGIADQEAWLHNFAGLNNPVVSIDSTIPVTVDNVLIDQQSGWKISGRLISNIDVGENNNQNVPDIVKISESVWQGIVGSYQSAYLDMVLYVWYTHENNELNVAYFNGTEFTDINSNTYSTYDSIKTELENMATSITVYE